MPWLQDKSPSNVTQHEDRKNLDEKMSEDSTFDLKDRVAVVTGGAGGIGLETAKALQKHGATVVISELNADRGQKAAQEFGLEFFSADVTNSAQVRQLAQHVQNQHGRLDIAFNNAGIAYSVPSEDCNDQEWLKVININLNAVFYCCREFGKIMLSQRRGSIINTASMSGLISNNPQPQCAYNAAKSGVIMLTKSLAGEWAKRGVRVNSISPGYINTPMTPKDQVRSDWYEVWMKFSPMGRIGEAQEIAPAVVFLASDASSFLPEATW
jgi:NAD(P)-dependent dehydrogenase (short-subunit alcohol dehydrogenase family)